MHCWFDSFQAHVLFLRTSIAADEDKLQMCPPEGKKGREKTRKDKKKKNPETSS